jgi:5-dehydro-2-deoxygluconokinase
MTGYDKPLYVLPFDHRGSFQKGLFGITASPSGEQTEEIASYKRVIFDGFLQAVKNGVPKDRAAILVDEQFGHAIARDARTQGFALAMPVEKSGQDEFDFEYGDEFGAHIEAFDVTFAKVLVRYNPEGDAEMNRRQADRLAALSRWLDDHDRKHRLMFELLVPAEPAQLESVGGDKRRYDEEVRPKLMLAAIDQLHGAGVEPDVWKIEGISSRDDCVAVAERVRSGGRDRVGCIVLGRGENEAKVVEWLSAAADVPGYIGFAVGRTTFWDPLVALKEGKTSREQAAGAIADNYRKFVDLFQSKVVA